jgi:hypothetical protein
MASRGRVRRATHSRQCASERAGRREGLGGRAEPRGRRVKGFEEHATDHRRLAAAASLARATGVEVAIAYRHLANGTARMLIESRAPAPRRRSSRSGGLDPKQALLELWSKREL